MRRRSLVAATLALGAMSGASGATITGSVDVRHEPPAIEPRPAVASVATPPRPAQPDRRKSVVYLEVAPQPAFGPVEGPPAVLDQRDESFQPYVLAVTVGTTVQFPNRDRTYHNVFSFSKAKRFDLGRYPRGQSRSVRFDRPGIVRVFCEIHSHMNAFILVFAHPFFALTDGGGRYQIDGVPPGEYQLTAWNDGTVRETRTVQVPPGAGTLQQDFALP